MILFTHNIDERETLFKTEFLKLPNKLIMNSNFIANLTLILVQKTNSEAVIPSVNYSDHEYSAYL